MRSRNLMLGGAVFAIIASVWFGTFALAQQDATPSPPATGSPIPAGTPTGGWKAWQTMELTDVQTGKTFKLSDYYGKTVLIQPMATWCSSCRQQLKNIRDARAAEGGEKIMVIAISIETTLKDEELADYAKTEGFDWPFVVASDDLLKALVKEFGRTVANPPSTPHFLLRPDGTFTKLETGGRSPEELTKWFEAAGKK